MTADIDQTSLLNSTVLLICGIRLLKTYWSRTILRVGYSFLLIFGLAGLPPRLLGPFSSVASRVLVPSLAVCFVCLLAGGLQALGRYRRRIGQIEESLVLRNTLEKQKRVDPRVAL